MRVSQGTRSDEAAEGRDGTRTTYSERLWAPVWAWLLPPALVSVVAIAYGSAYGALLGWLLLGFGTAIGWWALAAWSPLVRVDDRVLRAGRARLPLRYAGPPEALIGQAFREEVRSGDARAYVVVRPWATRSGVSVPVTDLEDPHPRWLVASRHPERLAAALESARAQALPTDPAE